MYRFMVSCETDDEDQARIVKKFIDSIDAIKVSTFRETVPGQPKPINEYLIEYQVLVTYEARVDATSRDEAVAKWKKSDCDDSEETEASKPVITKITNLTETEN